jgi:hypothetical protein
MKFTQRFFTVLAVILLVAIPAFAQTTANLTGSVIQEGAPLPGVTVTISSPNLQGVRTTVTDVNGNYSFRQIPPGEYTVKFEMEGMQTVTKTARAGLNQTVRADAELRLSAIAESITVTASAPAVLETTEVQTNMQADMIEDLPIGRTLNATTSLAPGVNTNGPNAGAITISGALAADNLFMVNGAVTNENLRGQTHNLFIEDAIQETTVQTAGISAEFGRFTGGVVNAITKSGGNEFSGSLRDSFTNPSWTEPTPLQEAAGVENIDTLNEVYEGTLGGRIIRDRLWFFAAGRFFSNDFQRNLTSSPAYQFTFTQEELRYEGKLTGAITNNHNLMLSYLNVNTEDSNLCQFACAEPSTIDAGRELPNDFLVARYNGIITDKFLLEASWTEKNFAFEGSGGDSRDLIEGTWGYDYGHTGAFFGAPVFCGVCDPEERNNSTYGVKGTYYAATRALGTHNIVAGYENWAEERISNNYQSGSDFGIYTYSEQPFGLEPGDIFMPIITSGDIITWWPILELTQGSDFATDSFYVNDKWDLSQNFSFNLGLRYDINDGKDASGNTVADDSALSPRLGAMWDVRGDGRFKVNAYYGRYVNRLAETIGSSQSAGGNPAYFGWLYEGPTISGLPTFEAFEQVFNWFNTQMCNAQGQCGTANFDALNGVSIPGLNVVIPESLVSPSVDEITVGFGTQLGANGFFRGDYIMREWQDFFAQRMDSTTGQTAPNEFGQRFDLIHVINDDSTIDREYDAIQLQAGYRFGQRWNLGGNYTWSETKGNQGGQTANSGPIADATLTYPEFKAFDEYNPVGFLPQDQEHKVRAWLSYDLPSFIGNFNFSLLQSFDSGTPYSAVITNLPIRAHVDPAIIAQYLTPPTTTNYYVSDRGEFRWDDITSTDIAINYTLPIRRFGVFVQAEMLNAFNEDGQIGGNSSVSRCQNFNPFTTHQEDLIEAPQGTPCSGTPGAHYVKSALFGTPTANAHFQTPRLYRFSAGFRF